MTSSSAPAETKPSSWRAYVHRGAVALVLGIVVGLAGGLAFATFAPKKYTATSRVLVTPTGVDLQSQASGGRTVDSINLDTEAQLVTSAAVVQGATVLYPALTRRSFEDLVKDTSVTVPPNTTVLSIAYSDDSAAAAQAGANAFATAYLDDRQKEADDRLNRQLTSAQTNVATLTKDLQTLTDRISKPRNLTLVTTQVALLKNQISSVNDQIIGLDNIQITPGRVVAAATRPTGPSSPSRLISLASGFAIGLLLGLFGAWWLTKHRRTVRTEDDLTHVVDAACIAVLPFADAGGARGAALYRRIALIATSAVPGPMTLVVTTPLESASASWIAAGVAASLSHSGTPAALLQVRPRNPAFTTPKSITATRVDQADDLVTGRAGGHIVDALVRVRGAHEALVVDVPRAAITADAQTLGAQATAVLLVVDSGTRSVAVREALEYLDSVGAPVLGTVLVRRGGGNPVQDTTESVKALATTKKTRTGPSSSPNAQEKATTKSGSRHR